MHSLTHWLHNLLPLDAVSTSSIEAVVHTQQVRKGETVLDFNKTCKYFYFVESGLLRGYYYENGKDICNWFASENEIANSLHSFVSQTPSQLAIQALEDSTLLCISYKDLQELYNTSNTINSLGRLLIEQCYLALEERNRQFQTKTATWRYQHLISQQPNLYNRVPLGHIASYLGVSQERLSRIRASRQSFVF